MNKCILLLQLRRWHDIMSTVLTYFDGRGHGERVRYALAAPGVEWSEWLLCVNLVGFGWSEDKEKSLETLRVAAARYLPLFEQALSHAGGTYITGTQESWAVFQLLYALDYTGQLLGRDFITAFPKCQTL